MIIFGLWYICALFFNVLEIEYSIYFKKGHISIGVGVPVPILKDGTVLRCANIGWGIFNVEDEFKALINLPVKACNDANVAALGFPIFIKEGGDLILGRL